MVDALHETWRVLIPNGILIDMRPINSRPPIEVVAGDMVRPVGTVDDSAAASDSAAADRAIQTIVQSGHFAAIQAGEFVFAHYWDSVAEMTNYLETRRHRMGALPSTAELNEVFNEAAARFPTSRLRCPWPIQLNSYDRKDAEIKMLSSQRR
jgi:hypothetical protein